MPREKTLHYSCMVVLLSIWISIILCFYQNVNDFTKANRLQVDVNHLDMYNANQNLCQGSKLSVHLLQVVLFEVQTIRVKTVLTVISTSRVNP